jgi:hypothetical protein
MERARRLPPATGPQDLDNVLRLRLSRERGPAPVQAPAPRYERQERRSAPDWSAALDAVEEAADAMHSTEHHAKEIETRGVALAERALAELRNAEERIRIAEEATRVAETRAMQAEARLREAEDWLSRIQDAIETRLLTRGERNPYAA